MTTAGKLRVLFSLIAPDALLPLIEQAYSLNTPIQCHLACCNDNDHYLVTAGQSRYILRVYPRSKHWLEHESDYLFEMEWLAYLVEQGVSVASPLPNKAGGYLGTLSAPEGPRHWALFHYAPGRITLDEAQSVLYGQSVAQIHLVSNVFQSVHPRVHFDMERIADRPLEQILAWLGDGRREDREFLSALVAELKEQIEAMAFCGDEYGIIGGDFHGGNHHFTEDNQITHFDFDLCSYSWRAYDLGIFRWSAGSQEPIWKGFLHGYESLRPLSERERRSIPIFSQLRHIWLMGSHTTYPTAVSWLSEGNWDRKFARLRELNAQWRESGT